MRQLLSVLLSISCLYLFSQNYPIGHKQYNFYDASRNRTIQTEVYYPAVSAGDNQPYATGEFPLVIFGHGFVMAWDAYANFWNLLVPKGYIIAFPRTEGSISPNHGAFGQDLRFLNEYILNLNTDSGSDFYQKLSGTSAIMGHSMGGGSSFLASANNNNLTALINFAAAETNPSAIAAAANVNVPTLMFYGVNDGVCPPSEHQIPMYQNLASSCKNIVGIIGGGHCYFANYNFNCSFGESTQNPSPTITREQQQQIVAQILVPYLDFILKGDAQAEQLYYYRLNTMNEIVFDRSCSMQHDLSITELLSPLYGCGLTANQNIKVRIKNNGANVETNIPIKYIFNQQAPVTEVFNGPIQPGETAVFEFSATVNANVPGQTYTFKVFTDLSNDDYRYNDTVYQTLTNTSVSIPLSVDFTGFNGTNLSTVFPGWREAQGTVPSGNTSTWVNRTGVGGTTNTTAKVNFYSFPIREWIIGPSFICSAYTKLKFDVAVTSYNSTAPYANGMGVNDSLRVFYSLDCGNTWQLLQSYGKNNNFTNNLQTIEIPLGQFANQGIAIGFQAFRQSSAANDYDFHLDNIMIFNESPYDLSVEEILAPGNNNCYGQENIEVVVKNTGINAIDFNQHNASLILHTTGAQNNVYNTNLTGVLNPNQSTIINLGIIDMSQNGDYSFEAEINFDIDGDGSNNSLLKTITVNNPNVEIIGNFNICEGQSTQLTANAQAYGNITFNKTSTTSVNILDNNSTGIISSLNVSEISSTLPAASVLKKVVIDSLIHTYVGDLKIELIAPDNSSIILVNKRGGAGDNYIRTEFSPSATVSITTITATAAPFTGTYLPEQAFSNLTGNVNGTWGLKVSDLATGDIGILHKWTLYFEFENNIVSYIWSNNGTNSQITVTPSQNGIFYVTVTDAKGCTKIASAEVQVVSASNQPDLGPNRYICQGQSVIISAGQNFDTYLWNTQETTASIEVSEQGTYSVTVTDACGSHEANVQVFVNQLPQLNLGDDISTCVGNDVNIYAGEFESYLWSTDENTPSISFTPIYSGTFPFAVTITDGNGCQNSDEIVVDVHELPEIELGEDLIICHNEIVTLQAGNFSEYMWSNNSSDSYIVVNANELQPGSYYYSVTVTDSNGCSASDEINVYIEICAGIIDGDFSSIKIYPNPANEFIYVELPNEQQISILDAQGQIIFSSSLPLNKHKVDLKHLPAGLYIITTDNNIVVKFTKI
jgi:subtilisin-like proprotein convertase family protein